MIGPIDHMPKMGLVVGIPFSRLVVPYWAVALAIQPLPANTNTCIVPLICGNPRTGTIGPPRDQAREWLVENALKLKASYLIMIDDDVEIPYGTYRQLLRTIKEAPEDVVMVGGIYPEKNDQCSPVVYQDIGGGPYWRWKRNTVFEVPLIGTGCCIFRTSVFEKLPKPWFKDIDESTYGMTDDAYFCMKAREAGYRIMADASVICYHWDHENWKRYEIPADSYPMQIEEVKSETEGWMTGNELKWLSDHARECHRIVEVGCYKGRSTQILASSTPGEVWAIDNFLGTPGEMSEDMRTGIFESFQKNVEHYPNVRWIKTDHGDTSKLPIEWLKGSPSDKPDMVFIDGAHDYESVKRDLNIWKSRIKPGGLLCGHDRDWEGVQKALNEVIPDWSQEAGNIWSWRVGNAGS